MANKKKILCIDDDVELLNALKIILESGGFTVITAESEDDGINKFKESKPDLVLLDLMMENTDSAVNFMNQIKKEGALPPIYLLSSVGTDFYQNVDINQFGFSGAFQKPIDPQNLLKLINTRLS
ncbi:MAG: hypothetical protein COS94_01355 [Candidatus Hydrogenedentes bacterium CG07_land_8_20_14_0_80_42_17]|nr:MAG: hypothetical protein COS94_01355 [Candidatus Hydrogenedentes bacterium CG07_land_8_20_14_0_80_42_17]